MKRWQTRGEVQDSDEEELSLDTNSHSLGYPSKRTKLDKDDVNTGTKQNGDQTKTTPSTLPDHEQVESIAHNDDATEAENTDSPNVVNTHGSSSTREDDKEPDWTTRTNTKTYGRLQRVPRQDAGKARSFSLSSRKLSRMLSMWQTCTRYSTCHRVVICPRMLLSPSKRKWPQVKWHAQQRHLWSLPIQ